MSNETYDEFARASIPGLSPLERLLLGHYCTRFNESVSPPRAWPPRAELQRITGAHEKSISRSLGKLTKLGFLDRVTLASKERGLRAEYAVNRLLIKSYTSVTPELPNVSDKLEIQVTSGWTIGNTEALVSNAPVIETSLSSYPKPIKPIKPKTNEVRFDAIIKVLPGHLGRTLSPGQELESLLEKLERQGISLEAVLSLLGNHNWNGAKMAYPIIIKLLNQEYAIAKASLTKAQVEKERARLQDKEQEERARTKLSPERVSEHTAIIRASLIANSLLTYANKD